MFENKLKKEIQAIQEAKGLLTVMLNLECDQKSLDKMVEAIIGARFPLNLAICCSFGSNANLKIIFAAIVTVMARAHVPIFLQFYHVRYVPSPELTLHTIIEKFGAGYLVKELISFDDFCTVHKENYYLKDYVKALSAEMSDSFVFEAGESPSSFLNKIPDWFADEPLIVALEFPADLLRIIVECLGDEELLVKHLAFLEVAAIRAIRGASRDNKFSSINYDLLNAVYTKHANGAGGVPALQGDGNSKDISDLLSSLSKKLSVRGHDEMPIPEGYMDVPADGLCFYSAIALQLRDGRNAQALQQMAIEEILRNQVRYQEFAIGHNGADFNAYLNYHIQRQEGPEGGWADHVIVQALANALGQVIEIQQFNLQGEALAAAPIRIEPIRLQNNAVLELGNLGNLHFVARGDGVGPAQIKQDEDEGKKEDDVLLEPVVQVVQVEDQILGPVPNSSQVPANGVAPDQEILEYHLYENAYAMLSGVADDAHIS